MTSLTFEKALIYTDRGVIISCNLLDAEAADLVPRDHLLDFLRLWREAYDVLVARDVAEPWNDIVEAIDILVDPTSALAKFGLNSARDFRFLKPCNAPIEAIATVKLAGSLERMFDDHTRRRFEAEGVLFPFNVRLASGENEVEFLMDLGISETQLVIGAEGFGDRTIWVTTKASMDAAMAGVAEEDRGDRARDILGLVHRKEGDVVVTVGLPAAALINRRIARPTLFDGVNVRFTSFPLEVLTGMSTDWGWTYDLRALLLGGYSSAGVPERICDSKPVGEFQGQASEFVPLGIVRVPRKDPDPSYDDLFAAQRRRTRSVTDLEAEIGKLR